MKRTRTFPLKPFQPRMHRGFSLVELMVGLTIGMVLVAGLSLLFANSSQSGNELEKSIRQIENGRYAVELLHDDLSLAGFYGEVPTDFLGYTTPDVCATALNSLGWDKTAPSDPKVPLPLMGLSPTEVDALPATCVANHKAGTVAFAVHRLGADAVAPAAVTASAPHVQTSRCVTDPVADPFIVSATAADFTLKNLQCNATNQVRQYVSRIYYIADCNECGSDTTPTLKMAELRGTQMTVVPLAEGIENMVLEYGFDTTDPADADPATDTSKGTPDIFRTGLSGVVGARDNDWANVVAVRLHLLSRTTERSPDYNDSAKAYVLGPASSTGDNSGFKRRVYTTTVRLTNVAGLREVPPPPTPASSPSSP
ncbi:PilW family protein [Acidovorax delafieldii]|nr:PilW family protein [Acidovorax delafieldii]